MFGFHLRTRLILSYLIVLVLGLGALTFSVGFRLQQALLNAREYELETEAMLIGLSLREQVKELSEDEDEGAQWVTLQRLQLFSDQVAQEHQRMVVIYDRTGRPLSTAASAPGPLPSEVVAALSGKATHTIRSNPATGEPLLYAAVPLFSEEHLVGAIEIAEPYARTQGEIDRTWTLLGLSAGTFVLLGAGVAV
ncbi:MAG TPA: hypothetical protein DEP84_27290, partial [Chloroflexi bacterium]|nr:hypothetical protein [Chloroflexota bacterium]